MRYFVSIAIGLLLTLGFGWTAVSYSDNVDFTSWVPKREFAAAEHVADLIRTRKFDQVGAALDPRFHWSRPDAMETMASFFPKNTAFKMRVTNWQTRWQKSFNKQGATTGQAFLQFRYDFPDGRAVLATFLFQRDNGKETITGINFAPLTKAQARVSKLSLTSMTGFQTVILLLAVLIDTFAIATCVLCLIGPMPSWRTRWLWALLSLVGVFRVNAVWTTGQLFFLPVSILFPPVGMTQMPVGTPWVFGFSLPVGAIVYWVFRSRRGWDKPTDGQDLRA